MTKEHWATTPPTKPGGYWWKFNILTEHPIYLTLDGNGYLDTGFMPFEVGGLWCGPLVDGAAIIDLEQQLAAAKADAASWAEQCEARVQDVLRLGTEIDRLRSGIVGKLVEAGTLEVMGGFHGLLIEVPVEDLRKAASVPLYRKVLVIDASLT